VKRIDGRGGLVVVAVSAAVVSIGCSGPPRQDATAAREDAVQASAAPPPGGTPCGDPSQWNLVNVPDGAEFLSMSMFAGQPVVAYLVDGQVFPYWASDASSPSPYRCVWPVPAGSPEAAWCSESTLDAGHPAIDCDGAVGWPIVRTRDGRCWTPSNRWYYLVTHASVTPADVALARTIGQRYAGPPVLYRFFSGPVVIWRTVVTGTSTTRVVAPDLTGAANAQGFGLVDPSNPPWQQ